MKKKVVVAVLILLLALPSYSDPPRGGTAGVRPKACTDVALTLADLPNACKTPGTYAAAAACADALAVKFPTIFPAVVLGFKQDGQAMNVSAHGQGDRKSVV